MKKNKQFTYIFILLFISVGVVYFVPALKSFFLIFILLLFFISKPKWDYFWVFFALLFVDNPGNLFWKETDEIIKFGPIVLSFLQCFIIVSLLKIILKKHLYKNIKVFYAKYSKPYFIWLIFLLIQGLFLGIEGGGATGYRYYYYFALTFIIFPIFFVMPFLIRNMNELIKLFKLLAVFVFLSFAVQIYNIIIGQSLHTLLGGTIPIGYDETTTLENAERMLRPIYFVYSDFFVFILSAFFLYVKNINVNKSLLYTTFPISLLSIFITGARGWVIAFMLYLLFLFLLDMISGRKFIPQKVVFVLLTISIILILSVPVVQVQFFKSMERMETLELILKGDPTAGGTNVRLTTRLYPVLDKFEERPITGWGFSKVGMETHDAHVGYLSPLMIGGVIGGVILIYFIYTLINKYYQLYKRVPYNSPYKKGILVLISSIIILLAINFTSAQVFGFYRYIHDGGSGAMWIAIYLSILNIVYYSVLNVKELR